MGCVIGGGYHGVSSHLAVADCVILFGCQV